MAQVAIAYQIDLPDGRRIWVPPTGRPYWAHLPSHCEDLEDWELEEYGLFPAKGSSVAEWSTPE